MGSYRRDAADFCSARRQGTISTVSPAATRPERVTRALMPKCVSWAAVEVAQQLGPLGLRAGVARGDRAALAGVQQPQLHAAREPQRAALPAVLGPGVGVERDVDVGAEAAQVDARSRAPRASAARVASTVTSRLRPRSWMPARSRCSRTGRPRSSASAWRSRGSSQPNGGAVRRGHVRVRGRLGPQRRRRARTGSRRARRAAAAPRGPSAASTRPCARAARRGCGRRRRRARRRGRSAALAGHRLHGPAPQLEHAAGGHRARIGAKTVG